MQTLATNSAILHELRHLPLSGRQEVLDFIQFLRSKTPSAKPQANRKSLKGIWQSKGFEQVDDLEFAIREARSELYGSILKREL